MGENKIKAKPEPVVTEDVKIPQQKEQPRKRSIKATRKLVRVMSVFGVFDRNQVVHAMPFILFITILLIGYIGNSYYAEKIIREIDQTKIQLKEKRADFISTKSELMFKSKQSEVARALEPLAIKESTEPPYKIIITANKSK